MARKKSDSATKSIRCKNMMYEQQIEHLPFPMEELQAKIEQLDPIRYAYIVHDHDVSKDGKIVAPHIHVMLCFENARYITSISKKLGEKPQYIKAWDKKSNNGFSYLLHATKGSSNKHQYDPQAVTANFDFCALVQNQIPAEIAEARAEKSGEVKTLLNMMYAGVLSKNELEMRLTGAQYGRYKNQIEAVWSKRLQRSAEKWRSEMLAQGKQVQVVWLYGVAGTGKTSLAKTYATKKGQDYYISGSSRDPFQSYSGEHTIILDELRPKTMRYHDLLRILDPFSLTDQTMAPSRFSDKAIACDLIIITTPYAPDEFYRALGEKDVNKKVDNVDQLLRRLALVVQMEHDKMEVMIFNTLHQQYEVVPGTEALNPYSTANRPTPKANPLDLYHSMLDTANHEEGGEGNDPNEAEKD